MFETFLELLEMFRIFKIKQGGLQTALPFPIAPLLHSWISCSIQRVAQLKQVAQIRVQY